jgi:hypothetical protein
VQSRDGGGSRALLLAFARSRALRTEVEVPSLFELFEWKSAVTRRVVVSIIVTANGLA